MKITKAMIQKGAVALNDRYVKESKKMFGHIETPWDQMRADDKAAWLRTSRIILTAALKK